MLGLGFLGLFLFFFGIGACLGLIYGVFIKGFPVWVEIGRDIGRIFKDFGSIFKEGTTEIKAGIKQGWEEAKADHQVWLEKKGWK